MHGLLSVDKKPIAPCEVTVKNVYEMSTLVTLLGFLVKLPGVFESPAALQRFAAFSQCFVAVW
jgi:hypothetical protein